MSLDVVPLFHNTLDDLWAEAETLGFVRVWTHTNWGDTARTGYEVTLIGSSGSTKLEIKCRHSSLAAAIGDAINEARRMGL